MKEGKPSATAYRVAVRRAAHQIFDHPRVLEDPIALPILGPDAEKRVREAESGSRGFASRYSRAFMAARSRFAEDELARAVKRGVSQYVILGAGLDTFSYRNPYAASALRVFEVDFPATQAWKRARLAAAGIAEPESLTFAPIDFETQSLADGLVPAGFDSGKAAFFSWLGVTMYLTHEAMRTTLSFIASLPASSGVVFDYGVPREALSWYGRFVFDWMSRRVARVGEPFRLFFEPGALAAELRQLGFSSIEDVSAKELNERYFANRSDKLEVKGRLGRLMNARV
ncbi:MAG TPA: class I SAM-dependent methyltransferase [Candidatus Acidoferrum sp.]|nr:class I SAM-dependent methyltransferase [Candidatus Acidoferrum sp.]